MTPLLAAIHANDIRMVNELIKNGAVLNPSFPLQTPPLHYALQYVQEPHPEIIKLLIKGGADVNKEHDGSTPILIACKRGNAEIISDLLKAGADPKRTQRSIFTAKQFDTGCESFILNLIPDKFIDYTGRLKALSGLLEMKAMPIGVQDNLGNTFLHGLAIKEITEPQRWKYYLNLFKKYEGDINLVNAQGETPLHLAAKLPSTEPCSLLIGAGAQVDVKDKAGNTPLSNALNCKYVQVISLLTKESSNFETTHSKESTPDSMKLSRMKDSLIELDTPKKRTCMIL
jgi:ankyrin repeat protein